MMEPITVTTENFEKEVLQSDLPVLIDFWASWCGPCKMLSPVVDEIAGEVTDTKICKVNVDDQPALAERFGVMSIPMLVLVRNGEIVSKSVGARPKKAVLDFLKG